MKRSALLLIALLLAGCGAKPAPVPAPASDPPSAPPPAVTAPAPEDTRTDLAVLRQAPHTRDQVREGLLRLFTTGEGTPQEKLGRLTEGMVRRPDAVPWVEADLDGDGQTEFALVMAVEEDPHPVVARQGAALFVIYHEDGQVRVDRSDPLDAKNETNLMAPNLLGAADLAGTGHPQVIWWRPEMIATGPQPNFVYVTAWKPGRFTNLPGQMALSNFKLTLDRNDLVLTGTTRGNTYLPSQMRTDRYRFVDGAFRLIDRRFVEHPQDGYARLWDGLVAEDSGRLKDAESAYQEAADPARTPSGPIAGYHMLPRDLTPEQMSQFGAALRPFARFRLGALLLESGRKAEAEAALAPDGGPYDGILSAMRTAADRQAGCAAGQAWAGAHPEFLAALNLGLGTQPWTPALLCSHIDINDHGFWE